MRLFCFDMKNGEFSRDPVISFVEEIIFKIKKVKDKPLCASKVLDLESKSWQVSF